MSVKLLCDAEIATDIRGGVEVGIKCAVATPPMPVPHMYAEVADLLPEDWSMHIRHGRIIIACPRHTGPRGGLRK